MGPASSKSLRRTHFSTKVTPASSRPELPPHSPMPHLAARQLGTALAQSGPRKKSASLRRMRSSSQGGGAGAGDQACGEGGNTPRANCIQPAHRNEGTRRFYPATKGRGRLGTNYIPEDYILSTKRINLLHPSCQRFGSFYTSPDSPSQI